MSLADAETRRLRTDTRDRLYPRPPAMTGLARHLKGYGLTPSAFREFLDMPYDRVMEQVREAAAGGEPAYPFMVRRDFPPTGYEHRIVDPASAEVIAARRIIGNRLVHCFVLRAVFRMSDQEFADRVDIRGWGNVEESLASGSGVFVLNSHFGPGHLVPIIMCRLGCRVTGLTATDSYPLLGIDLGDHFIPIELAGTFLPKALTIARDVLSAGGIVHSTGDGYAAHTSKKRRFLGKYRRFAEGAGYLCYQTGAQCLPVFVRSDEFGQLRIDFGAPLLAGASAASREEYVDRSTDEYVALLEQRWLSDFGNVSPHALDRFAERAASTASV